MPSQLIKKTTTKNQNTGKEKVSVMGRLLVADKNPIINLQCLVLKCHSTVSQQSVVLEKAVVGVFSG